MRQIKKNDDFGNLGFEGEYLNGKRHGKGKQYDNFNKLIFEGDYINGIKWNGKGKQYFDNYFENYFEYEYINGNSNVKGKEYYNKDKLKYEGEFIIYGKFRFKNGKIKQYDYYSGLLVFDGQYKNGKRHGKGKEYGRYGRLIFEGYYLNGKKYKGKKYGIELEKDN